MGEETSFKGLGIIDVLCEACERLNWKTPTAIQKEAIPPALQGKDVIGLAETGSGKTAAFALPILQDLLSNQRTYFALVLTPTRELAFQIKEQFDAIGKCIGLKSCVIVGGVTFDYQSVELRKKKPHIIVATPGRLVDHLNKTPGFHLKKLKYLVMDEADRILDMDFEVEVDKILSVIPQERRTMLFSATMTSKVNKLQKAHLQNPIRVEVSSKYQAVSKLQQYMLFIPWKYKLVYLAHILKRIGCQSVIIFCSTHRTTLKTALILRNLGYTAVALNGKMSQSRRLVALNKFKASERSILLATSVASRGLDIPNIDYVINFDVPAYSKDYIHRVGRTARAGKSGVAITIVTQYEIEVYQRLELLLNQKLPVYPVIQEEALMLKESVSEAEQSAKLEMARLDEEANNKKKRKRLHEENGTKESIGFRNDKLFKKNKRRS